MSKPTTKQGKSVVVATRVSEDFLGRIERACAERGYRNMSRFLEQAVIEFVHAIEKDADTQGQSAKRRKLLSET